MQRIWWLVIGGVVVLFGLLTVLGFAMVNRGGDKNSESATEICKPQPGSPSAGNANVDGRAVGKGYQRQLVIHVTDKRSGAPVRGAEVKVQGIMDCPHYMPLYQKELSEASNGTYKADYQLVMQGHWVFHVVVRSKQNGTTTAAFPVTMQNPG